MSYIKTFLFTWLTSIGLLHISPINCYIYHIHTLYNKQSNQHVILLAEAHYQSSSNNQQRLDILKQACNLDAFIIAEDQLFTYPKIKPDGILLCEPCLQPILDDFLADPAHFDPTSLQDLDTTPLNPESLDRVPPMFLLTHFAHNNNLEAVTVECRQAKNRSAAGWPISASQVYKSIKKLTHDIKNFDDGVILNSYYKNCIQKFNHRVALSQDFWDLLKHDSRNLKEIFFDSEEQCYTSVKEALTSMVQDDYVKMYCARGLSEEKARKQASEQARKAIDNFQSNIYDQFMCSVILFLVDTRILHQIASHKHKQIIFVIAGGNHIDEILPVLQQLDFTVKDHYGTTLSDALPIDIDDYLACIDLGNVPATEVLENFSSLVLSPVQLLSAWAQPEQTLPPLKSQPTLSTFMC